MNVCNISRHRNNQQKFNYRLSPDLRMSAARLVGCVAVASVSLFAAYLLYVRKVGEFTLCVDILGVKSSLVILIYPEGGV